jgi:hypothetical protein
MTDINLKCPVPACGYNVNRDQYQKDIERPLILESTRSHSGEDSWRDMDGFDENEELSRLRRALHEIKTLGPKNWDRHKPWILEFGMIRSEPPLIELGAVDKYVSLLLFIAEATSNLDFLLMHLGSLPTAWASSRTVTMQGIPPDSEQADICFHRDESSPEPKLKVNLDTTLGIGPIADTFIVKEGNGIYYTVDILIESGSGECRDFKAYVQRRFQESETASHGMGPLRLYHKKDLTLSDVPPETRLDLRVIPFLQSVVRDIVDNYNADRFNDKPKIQV